MFVMFIIALMWNFSSIRFIKKVFLLIDILVNISIECFIRAYIFFLFLSAHCPPIVGAVIRQSLSVQHFFLSGKFAAPLWAPSCNLLVCGGTGSVQNQRVANVLKRVANFGGLSAGTNDGPFDANFPVRNFVYSSKGHMSRPCWSVPALFGQALNPQALYLFFKGHFID